MNLATILALPASEHPRLIRASDTGLLYEIAADAPGSTALPLGNAVVDGDVAETYGLESVQDFTDQSHGLLVGGKLAVVEGDLLAVKPPVISGVGGASINVNATVGEAFSYQIEAANEPTSFNAVGLFAGLEINPATGEITGTPEVDGEYTVTIFANNGAGEDTTFLVITVAAVYPSMTNAERLSLVLLPEAQHASAVRVSGSGAADGIYTLRSLLGSQTYGLLGIADADVSFSSKGRLSFDTGAWAMYNPAGSGVAHANEGVATPDLVGAWLDNSGDPTGITVTTAEGFVIDFGQSVTVTDWEAAGLSTPNKTLRPPADSFVVSDSGDPNLDGLYLRDYTAGLSMAEDAVTSTATDGHFKNYVSGMYCVSIEGIWKFTSGFFILATADEEADAPWLPEGWSIPLTVTPAVNADPTWIIITDSSNLYANGLYSPRGEYGGKTAYCKIGLPWSAQKPFTNGALLNAGGGVYWEIYGPNGTAVRSDSTMANPWATSTWTYYDDDDGVTPYGTDSLVITPRIAYAAAMTSDCGNPYVNLIYLRGNGVRFGAAYFSRIDFPEDAGFFAMAKNGPDFNVYTEDGPRRYYGDFDVIFPWMTAFESEEGEEEPPPTVFSVSQGELDAGITISGAGDSALNDAYASAGATYGAIRYRSVYEPTHYARKDEEGGEFKVGSYDDGDRYKAADNAMLPWAAAYYGYDPGGTIPAPTVTRNDVASEANWV